MTEEFILALTGLTAILLLMWSVGIVVAEALLSHLDPDDEDDS